jgi:hypothetical protein
MGKYGQTAKIATELLIDNQTDDPVRAWDIATIQVFPNSISSRNKGCPKNSFLGFCEAGYIVNVMTGNYTSSKKNKNYAIKAISLLRDNSTLTKKELWKLVIDEPDKKHNSQMDVVKTLWDNKYIKVI